MAVASSVVHDRIAVMAAWRPRRRPGRDRAPGSCPVTLTVERAIAADEIPACSALYAAAVPPARTRAEFTAELTDKRIEKYLVRDSAGTPVALTNVTDDVSAAAWITPGFHAARYPEHAARGAVFYLGHPLVRPGFRTHEVFTLMLDAIVARLVEARAVRVVDAASYNGRRALGRSVAGPPSGHDARMDRVDVPTCTGDAGRAA